MNWLKKLKFQCFFPKTVGPLGQTINFLSANRREPITNRSSFPPQFCTFIAPTARLLHSHIHRKPWRHHAPIVSQQNRARLGKEPTSHAKQFQYRLSVCIRRTLWISPAAKVVSRLFHKFPPVLTHACKQMH